jgi:hypothetical protein
MATTLKQIEASPASYPDAPVGLSAAAAALDADMIWQRIESYIAHRWTDREVIWTVEGSGDWSASLTPATVTAVEIWQDNTWAATTPDASFLGGFDLPSEGPYRITADVGSGTPPAGVLEAFRRLAEYMADATGGPSGAASQNTSIGPITTSYDRNPAWLAKAMQLSGAGDLLRPYRRA